MDLISVIIPTYNRCDVVSRSIRSVLKQTYSDFELLVVDDGSTDETRNLIRSYDDDRLTYIEKRQNEGVSAARNVGIEHATGECFLFLDSDDELVPSALETLLETLEEGRHVCVTPSNTVIYGNGTVEDRIYLEQTVTLEDLVAASSRFRFGGTSGTIVDATAISEVGSFDENLHLLEDHDLFLRLAKRYPIYSTSDVVLVVHKTDDDRLTTESNIHTHRNSVTRFLRKHEETLSAAFLATEYSRLAHFCARAGDRTEAQVNFRRALSHRPMRPAALLYYAAVSSGKRPYEFLQHGEARYKRTKRIFSGILSLVGTR